MEVNTYKNFCSNQYVSRETYEKLIIFHKTLMKWQKAINLVSKSTIENAWTRHFLDSAQLYKYTKPISGNIIDIGSGAGFPGLILAIMGNQKIHLVECDRKKCTFLREVAMLTETGVCIHNSRIENLDFFNVELVLARALAPLTKLFNYVEIFMKKSPAINKKFPKMLFLKGKSYKSELKELNKIKNFSYEDFHSITDSTARIIYIKNVEALNVTNE